MSDAVPQVLVVRLPVLPFTRFRDWTANLTAPTLTESSDRWHDAVMADWDTMSQRLLLELRSPLLREAVYLGSPDLMREFGAWEAGSKRGKDVDRLIVGLAKYFARACGRPTPFGLFGSLSVGQVGGDRTIIRVPADGWHRHTRLEARSLQLVLNDGLAAAPEARRGLTVSANPTVHRVGDRFHYIEALPDGQPRFTLASASVTPPLETTLDIAATPIAFSEVSKALVNAEVTPDEAAQFVEDLVASGIMVDATASRTICDDHLGDVQEDLVSAPGAAALMSELRGIDTELKAIDAAGVGIPTERYERIAARVSKPGQSRGKQCVCHVDAFRSLPDARISARVSNLMLEGASVLFAAAPQSDPLRQFRDRFHERYEREPVPLLEALDQEIGVGFEYTAIGPRDDRRAPILSELVVRAAQSNATSVELTDRDIARLTEAVEPGPRVGNTFVVSGSIEQLERQQHAERVHVDFAAGPLAASLFGRFCHGSVDIRRHVAQLLDIEAKAHPDAILADIAHLPYRAAANFMLRPRLTDHVIAVSGNPDIRGATCIKPSDLRLQWVDNELLLFSASLGRRVIPIHTTSFNFTGPRNLPLFQFLASLQLADLGHSAKWTWGDLSSLPFLPRITRGQLVLSRARWQISADELPDFSRSSIPQIMSALRQWRRDHRAPRCVAIQQGDTLLPLDFEAAICIGYFSHLLKRHSRLVLVEMAMDHDALLATSDEGRYVSELMVPYARVHTVSNGSPPVALRSPSPRARGPGSEWLYLKVYAGRNILDRVLRQLLSQVHELHDPGVCDRWFFVRYGDPEGHFRLRCHGEPGRLRSQLMPSFDRELGGALESRLIWRFQYDTYRREVERYGGDAGLDLAEKIFCSDSGAAVQLLSASSSKSLDSAVALTALSMERLARDLGQNSADRLELYRSLSDAIDASTRREWSRQYREERSELEGLLALDAKLPTDLAGPLDARSNTVRSLIETCGAEAREICRSRGFVTSVLHMCHNRLCASMSSFAETRAYDHLTRVVGSQRARLG